MDKLKHYGVEGVAYDLLKNYLENQKQFVQLNDHSSELKCVLNGVPQSSILGPLLSLIYITDIPNSIQAMSLFFYSMQMIQPLFCNLEDIDGDNQEFTQNQELQHEWSLVKRLQLHVKKTQIHAVS